MTGGFGLDLQRALLLVAALFRWGLVPLLRRLLRLRSDPHWLGRTLRHAIEALGITYVKLGQYLAMRSDLFPPEVCAELSRLLEDARPMTFEQVRQRVEGDLGGPISRFFSTFDPVPIGAASVAQVHRAVALDGDELAVKVQRPGIEAIFRADMRNLRRLAWLLDGLRLLGAISASETVEEFMDFTLREMSFLTEARTAERLRRDMRAHRQAYAPRIRWDLTTDRVLSMEYIAGISLQKLCTLAETGHEEEIAQLLPGVDVRKVISRVAEACLHQLFITGFFHGDPHPGNLLVRSDGEPVFIDCGIYGELDDEQRRDLRGYLRGVAAGRFEEGARYFRRLCILSPQTDVHRLHVETTAILKDLYTTARSPTATKEERNIGRYHGIIISMLRRNHARLKKDQLLVSRAMALLDTTTLRLPVRFDLWDRMDSFFRRHQPSPMDAILEVVGNRELQLEVAQLAWRLPRYTGEILERASRSEPKARAERQNAGPGGQEQLVALGLLCTTAALLAVGTVGSVLFRYVALGACLALLVALLAPVRSNLRRRRPRGGRTAARALPGRASARRHAG